MGGLLPLSLSRSHTRSLYLTKIKTNLSDGTWSPLEVTEGLRQDADDDGPYLVILNVEIEWIRLFLSSPRKQGLPGSSLPPTIITDRCVFRSRVESIR